MKIKPIVPGETSELNEWLFAHHTHAEIVNDQNPEQIVYREKDVIELIKLLRNEKI